MKLLTKQQTRRRSRGDKFSGYVKKKAKKAKKLTVEEFWFGKFKNTPIKDVPTYYLEWALENVNSGKYVKSLKKTIKTELDKRN